VLGADDLILLLTHHWARDTSIFPTEDQRLTLAAIMLLLIYTGCRPAELVDAAKRKATSRDPAYEDDNWDSGYDSTDDVQDNDPAYGKVEPWANPNDIDYDDDLEDGSDTREYKALCYKDIRLWIVQNSSSGERDLLAMEITLAHHKGADKKPKPYVPITVLDLADATPLELPSSFMKRVSRSCVLSATSWPSQSRTMRSRWMVIRTLSRSSQANCEILRKLSSYIGSRRISRSRSSAKQYRHEHLMASRPQSTKPSVIRLLPSTLTV